jgi:hypothetical protein
MGNVTPNISIYIPFPGEENYDQAFAAGMMNIDQHDHTGGPNKGLPITSSGIGAFAIDYTKLNANVADAATGVQAGAGALGANQIATIGILRNIYQNADPAGFFAKTGVGVVAARTFTFNANQLLITNPAGIAGNPNFSLSTIVTNTTQPAFVAYKAGNQTIPRAVDTKITYSTEDFDQGSNYSSSTFTAPRAGVYLFNLKTEFGTINNFGNWFLYIYKNGVQFDVLFNANLDQVESTGTYVVTSSYQIKLALNDTVEIFANIDQGATDGIVQINSMFSGVLLC